jgi:hypothetical protein
MKISSQRLKDEVRDSSTIYKYLLNHGITDAAILAGHNYLVVYGIYQKLTGMKIKGVPTLSEVRNKISKLEIETFPTFAQSFQDSVNESIKELNEINEKFGLGLTNLKRNKYN